ncbi:MAG: hypothetical protein KAJ01_09415 [Candidatus Hydrogenedentes bacterium]|nr:hypothetical protein [Candidatus Hydrogenedentota bacterium]
MKKRQGGGDKAWKSAERRVGGMMGLPAGHQREGPTGLFDCVSTEGLTVHGRHLGVEVKYRKTVPDWLWMAISQADQNAQKVLMKSLNTGDGTAMNLDPIVVIVPHHSEEPEFLCALRFVDYLRLRAECDSAQRELKEVERRLHRAQQFTPGGDK